MPATDVTFGITRHAGALIDSVETTTSVEKKVLKGSTGNDVRIKAYNQTTSFSVKGHGTTSVVPGFAGSGISGLTGGVTLIETFKRTDTNDDFDSFEYSGTHYPNGQDV